MGEFPRRLFDLVIIINETVEKNTTFQSQILDIIGESISVADAEGKIVFWNKASEKTCVWKKTVNKTPEKFSLVLKTQALA
jgi:hypothetical protein